MLGGLENLVNRIYPGDNDYGYDSTPGGNQDSDGENPSSEQDSSNDDGE